MLCGVHDARWSMFFALMGSWGIGLPLDVLLPFLLGLDGIGIRIGLSSGLAIVACLIIRWWRHREALGWCCRGDRGAGSCAVLGCAQSGLLQFCGRRPGWVDANAGAQQAPTDFHEFRQDEHDRVQQRRSSGQPNEELCRSGVVKLARFIRPRRDRCYRPRLHPPRWR
jgi:hypothetical protein